MKRCTGEALADVAQEMENGRERGRENEGNGYKEKERKKNINES